MAVASDHSIPRVSPICRDELGFQNRHPSSVKLPILSRKDAISFNLPRRLDELIKLGIRDIGLSQARERFLYSMRHLPKATGTCHLRYEWSPQSPKDRAPF